MGDFVRLLEPEVIRSLGASAAALLVLCVIVLVGGALGVRAVLREAEQRRRHERELQALWQQFIGNHMSENVRINQQVEQSLGHLTERLASMETRVSECPTRGAGNRA